MSKKQFKSQASSGRIGSGFGGFGGTVFGSGQSSILSYVQEPPDLSSISDPNVTVAIKNLSKKDGTTKAKALEDLQSHVSSSDVEIEDGLLEAWAKLFPRLSIADNNRRVRQLSHAVNGQICSKCGKRTVKHLPRIAGPWLAGTFDSDRAAARSASDTLGLVFSSPEKLYGVRRTFQRSILEYCRDATLHETAQTLSDERTVSGDDAKATHARVVATALWVTRSLLVELSPDDRSKEADVYEEIFQDPKIWSLVHYAEPSVRRAMNSLSQTILEKHPVLVAADLNSISKAFIYQGLHSNQTSSALEFVRTLERLTERYPTIWTEFYTGKKPAVSRLSHFLKQGSQASPPAFWETLSTLLKSLPNDVLPTKEDDISELLSATRTGVSRKEERFNASVAWPVYFTLAARLIPSAPKETAESIARANVLPVIKQYLDPSAETAEWTITGAKASAIVSQAGNITCIDAMLQEEWPLQAEKLIELARMSQPEQAKDFDRSQKHVATTGERFADLQRELSKSCTSLKELFISTSHRVVKECVGLLESRNGKPFGAAAIIDSLLRTCSQLLLKDHDFQMTCNKFFEEQLATLAFGPCKRHLIQALYTLRDQPEFIDTINNFLERILVANESVNAKLDVLRATFNSATPVEAASAALDSITLQNFIAKEIASAASPDCAVLFANLLKAGVVSDQTVERTLSELTTSLDVNDDRADSLAAIETIWNADEGTVRKFMSGKSTHGQHLLPAILRLEELPDDTVAEKAAALSVKLSSAISKSADSHNKFSIIVQNLETISTASMSMESLTELTGRFLGPDGNLEKAANLLPSLEIWQSTLAAVMEPPKPSLALTSPLSGTVQIVDDSNRHAQEVHHDSEGLSQALRISMYITRLLTDTDLAAQLVDQAARVHALLYATIAVADDNLSIPGANRLWQTHDQDTEETVLHFVEEANKAVNVYLKTMSPSLSHDTGNSYAAFTSSLRSLQGEQDPRSSPSYYTGLCSARAHDSLYEYHGSSADHIQQCEAIVKERRSANDFVGLAAAIAGFHQPLAGSKVSNRYCNELVADLTEMAHGADDTTSFERLAIFNIVMSTQEDGIAVIAKQRRIFLVKRLISWLESSPSLATQAELCKALNTLSEGISDMYGEQWDQILTVLIGHWTENNVSSTSAADEHAIVMMNASLRLLGTLRRLAKVDEPNDDLVEVLVEKQDKIRNALVQLLVSAGDSNDENHQPLLLTHELLARQLAACPFKLMEDADEMFSLLYAPSRAVMQAAFNLLHRQISTVQEQISFDAALDNKTAQLPDELLSLLLEAPTLDSLADASFHRMMPLSLQSHLFSWRLLFDHFEGSSYKVKNDYIEQLKDGSYLKSLLDLIFDFLGHTRGRPVDASKFDVQEYTPDVEPSPERDVQWLLAHLYFLAVTYLPSLVKSYYLDIRSRQTSQAIDTWMARYISPLVIRSSLEAVEQWSKKSVQEDPEYEKMSIKVGMRSREINVSYVVDEQTMAIKVVLPEAYPLASAQVVGVSRVAVKEEKWQSWLRNCQGVITFSNGSITDGLAAWRRNVTGALKGQTECAICYSIISADKQLPTKRCPTCKNLFHASCLFKWFKTSNASTCPLCRNPFNFN